MNPQRIFLLIFIALASSCWVQSAPPSTGAPLTITIEFTGVAWEHAITDLSMPNAAKPVKLEFPAFEQSQVYRYTGPNPILFKRADPARERADPNYTPPTRAVFIPPDAKRILFLILPSQDGSFGIKAIPDDLDKFKLGSVRIINVTGEKLAINTRTQSVTLASEKQEMFNIPSGAKQLDFLYSRFEENTLRPVGSNAFATRPEERCTVIITKTTADAFRAIAHDIGPDGKLTQYRLPPRAFQVFAITEKIRPQS